MGELSNYIPINRRIFEHDFFKEERVYSKFEAWLDLLQQARFEDSEARKLIGNKIVRWNRGQLIASLRFLANRWLWSTKKVTGFLNLLQEEGMIKKETQKETGQSLITICKYESYNSNSKERKQERKHQGNTEETPRKQDGNKTNKVNKEEIKKIESEREEPRTPVSEIPPSVNPEKKEIPPVPAAPLTINKLDEFERVCLDESPTWQANMAKTLGLPSIEAVLPWIRKYFDEMRAGDVVKIHLGDTKNHCFRWIKIEMEKEVEKAAKKEQQQQNTPQRGVAAGLSWGNVQRRRSS